MTKTNKSLLTVILAILCSVLIAMGVGFSQPVAYAEDGTALENATFVMDGPEVRVDGNNGMRFMAKMSKTDYEKVVGAYDSVEFGVIIMPEYYLGLAGVGAIDYESVFGTNAKFAWDMDTAFDGAKYNVIHMNSNASEYDETTMSVKGSVVEMKPENLATAYVANVYAKATKGEVVEYKFATMAEENSSMLEVAFKALNSGVFAEGTNAYDTLNGYKTQYEEYKGGEATYSYTVNYVANGQTIKSDKVEGIAMNTAVEAEIALPEGYVLDDNFESVTKGHIYASDIELTVYVKVKPTIDITAQSIDGTLGILASVSNKETQSIVLPVDFAGLTSTTNSVIMHWTDTWSQAMDVQSYDVNTRTITFSSSLVATRLNNVTSGNYIYDCTIDTVNATYKAKIQCVGYKTTVNFISTAEDLQTYLTAKEFVGGELYVLTSDIDGAVVENKANPSNGLVAHFDGRGHALTNLTIKGYGLLGNYFNGTFKNTVVKVSSVQTETKGLISGQSANCSMSNIYVEADATGSNAKSVFRGVYGGCSFTNMVINVKGFEDVFSGTPATETNVVSVTETFFTDNASLNYGSFAITEQGLTFNGKLVYAKA